ncbi:hypothetical protein [uncultured Christiangramia sp.]|uniref:hypothetical protein n=1 Tax=uncultured Christiangramia sp. TaxID=503836 RepID=UPI002623392C|nr:hypothetical protein [uncultured Christiangramia sp.]
MSEDSNIQFVNAEKLNVTERIKDGRTRKFTDRKEAEEFAFYRGCYLYDLYYYVVQGSKNSEVKPFGFAVPN